MITTDHFSNEYLDKIQQILFNEKNKPIIRVVSRSHTPRTKDRYNELYESTFIELPINYGNASDEIVLYSDFVYNYEFYYAFKDKSISVNSVLSEVEIILSQNLAYDIYEYIQERIQCLVYNFKQALIIAKDSYYFDGLNDNELIIKNLLVHYQRAYNSKEIQLNFFTHLILTKEISDLLTKAYVFFLEDKLLMYKPDDHLNYLNSPNLGENVSTSLKIIWNGTQKNLAELFIELQQKGWINPISELGFQKTSKIICDIFDISHTKKRDNSNHVNSLTQLLKGTLNSENKTIREYFFSEPEYPRKFNDIQNCHYVKQED